jgi:hypothetical protein
MTKECLQRAIGEYFVAELEEIDGLKDLYFCVKKWSNPLHQSHVRTQYDCFKKNPNISSKNFYA